MFINILLLYCAIVAGFMAIIYFQAQLIWQLWRFLYVNFRFSPLRLARERSQATIAAEQWRTTPPVVVLLVNVRKAWVFAFSSMLAFMAVGSPLAFMVPTILENGFLPL
jgi:hypothetical protein